MGLFSNNQNKHGLISKFKKLYRKCCVPDPEDCCVTISVNNGQRKSAESYPPNSYNVKIYYVTLITNSDKTYSVNETTLIYDENILENGFVSFNNRTNYSNARTSLLVEVQPLTQELQMAKPIFSDKGGSTPILGEYIPVEINEPINVGVNKSYYIAWNLINPVSGNYLETITVNIFGGKEDTNSEFLVNFVSEK